MNLRPIRPGDTIGLVSPASPLTPEKCDFIIRLLQDFGYRTKTYPHTFDFTDYLAGTDEDRAAEFQAAFDDPETVAVLCTRGGYGCARIVDRIDWDRVAASRKGLFGFSDITTFHLALQRRGVASVHSPMALTLSYPRADYVYDSFRGVLAGDLRAPDDAPPARTIVGGAAEGVTVGGCLCLLTDSIATKNPLSAEGRILLIEDVDEHPHRVDAMLTHLINAGIAQSAAGFVIGEMTRSDERVDEGIGARPWRDIVIDRLAPLGKPMVIEFPFGHVKGMLTLPLGLRARLDADAGTLTYLEPLYS